MIWLIVGLIVFLGAHSVRVVGEGWRTKVLANRSEGFYKGIYSLVSAVGLGLIIWGYGQARQAPVVIWAPPVWTKHLAALLMLFSFILLIAAYVPRNLIKQKLKHPMTLAVKVWALAHLVANGTLADVLLFGGFLVWAVLVFGACRQRDRGAPAGAITLPTGSVSMTILTIVVGLIAWAFFAVVLHAWLIGVRPFG
jgi:uncharacterized membrane protein